MESQTTIIPLELTNGTIVRVEATPIGEQQVGFQKRPFKEATDVISHCTIYKAGSENRTRIISLEG